MSCVKGGHATLAVEQTHLTYALVCLRLFVAGEWPSICRSARMLKREAPRTSSPCPLIYGPTSPCQRARILLLRRAERDGAYVRLQSQWRYNLLWRLPTLKARRLDTPSVYRAQLSRRQALTAFIYNCMLFILPGLCTWAWKPLP